MNKKYKIILVLLLGIIFLSGCGSNTGSSVENGGVESSNLQVYTSIYPIYDFVSKIGGDKVDVYALIKSGEDAHSFEPTANDIINLENADILFYNGAGLETWIEKIENSISNENLKFVNLSENIELIGEEEEEDNSEDAEENNSEYYHEYDPHIWLSPLNAVTMSTTILEKLIELDPENEAYYTSNCRDLVENLANLHLTYNNELGDLDNKEILVTHNAYGYLCELYGIEQVSISNNIENDESSPAKLIEIIKYIEENDIKYILTDGVSSQKIAESIADETGVEILVLSTLESLSEKERKNDEDYLSIMYKNLEVLKSALS